MRALREKMKEAAKRDNRGLSLVEILCAVAIFSLIVAGVSTIIVLSSKTFRRGVTETNLQQEAQLVANRIGTIVQDACEASFDSGTLTLKTSDADGNVKTYEIIHQDGELRYKEEGTPFYAKLAGKIEEFTVATDDFDKSNTVYLDMKLADDNKVYKVQYAIAARNEMTADFPAMGPGDYLGLLCDSEVVMVPGETYTIPVDIVSSTSSVVNILAIPDGSGYFERLVATPGSTAGSVDIKLKDNIPTSVRDIKFTVETEERKPGTSEPRSSAQVIVHVRQVKRVEVTHERDNSEVEESKRGSSYEAQGCVHKFTANVQATYAEKRVGAPYENGYEDPKAVNWTVTATGLPAGKTYRDYFEDPEYGTDDNGAPTVECKIHTDLPSGLRITALATSNHAKGVNKGGVSYYNDANNPPAGYDSVTKADGTKNDIEKGSSEQWGYNSFEARPAKINPPDEISLDPTETGSVKLIMKGGKLTDIECIPRGNTDSSTQAYFNPSDNCVYVKIGKDERGSGITPSDPKKKFTFTVDVCDKNTGDKKATITVHVKRVDKIILDKEDNKDGSYTFTTKFNVDRREASLEDVENNSLYLINNKYNPRNPDGSLQNRTPFTLGVVYTFQVQVDGKKIPLGHIISRATCATEPNADKNIWDATFNSNNGYITWEDYPSSHSAAVTGEDTDSSHLMKLPTLKIKKGNKSFEKITVTAIAFHALGAEKGEAYLSDATGIFENRLSYGVIQDEQVIYGDREELIVVEPGQGTNDPKQSDEEMAIPIEASGAYKMTAVISGNSSKDTKLSDYAAQGKDNPFSNDNKIWYLGLIIGKDEKGKNGSGTFTLTVTAYGSDEDVLETFNYNIAVRCVTEAKIEATAENADQGEVVIQDDNGNKYLNYAYNKANSKITLSATVTGLCGTEYFDIQKDGAGNVKRWEQDGHGKYRTPYSIKWSIYDKKGKELNLSDYFESVPTMIDVPAEGVTKSTITFTLKKALPNGTRIRATSLHAKGDDGGEKYNKAGEMYADVYDEIVIGKNIIVADGFQRADEYTFVSNIPKLREKYFCDAPYKSSQRSFYRYREVDGEWSQYYLMDDESENIARVTGYQTARIFLPDKEYELDIVNVVYSKENKVIYWPLDESLLEPGKGWKEEGFSLYQWDTSVMTEEEKNFQYEHVFLIPKTEIFFEPYVNQYGTQYQTITGRVRSIGSESSPINLKTGGSFAATLAPTAFNLQKTQYHFTAILQKKVDGKWVTISQDNMQNLEHWFLQTHCPSFSLYNIYDEASGNYRICTTLKDMEWKKVQGGLFKPEYVSHTMDTPLYDFADDTGVLYLKFN